MSSLLGKLLDCAETRPDHVAVWAGEFSCTYGELVERIAGTADALREAGAVPGARILYQAPNGLEAVILYFGIHGAGCVSVPIDEGTDVEIRKSVERVGPGLFIAADAIAELSCPQVSLNAITSTRAPVTQLSEPAPTDLADILYTTGTTGTPKGVMLSHANISQAAINISTFLHQTPEDVEVAPIPFSHSFGLGRVRCMAHVGSTLVPIHGLRSPLGLLKAIEKHGATGLALVPSGFAILRRVAKDALKAFSEQLRYVEIGSAAMDATTRAWLCESLPQTRLCHHYGLTEASRAAFVELHSEAAKAGSIGQASPNVEIELRNAAGHAVATGETGELWIRGGMVMSGYADTSESASPIANEWLRTHDLASADETGNLYLRGRTSDIINVGGLKVAPQEVERMLQEVDGIEEVACVGFPDPAGFAGERVRAFVVLCEGTPDTLLDGLPEILRKQKLQAHKIPADYVATKSLPKTASGKLRRSALRTPADAPTS